MRAKWFAVPNMFFGMDYIYPYCSVETWSYKDICEFYCIPVQMLNSIVRTLGLKKQEYGKYFVVRSKNKKYQYKTFRFYNNAVKEIENYLVQIGDM